MIFSAITIIFFQILSPMTLKLTVQSGIESANNFDNLYDFFCYIKTWWFISCYIKKNWCIMHASLYYNIENWKILYDRDTPFSEWNDVVSQSFRNCPISYHGFYLGLMLPYIICYRKIVLFDYLFIYNCQCIINFNNV